MTPTTEYAAQQGHVDAQLARLEARLVGEWEQVPVPVLHECVQQARARFTGARVLTFVPILVERLVRAQLRDAEGDHRGDQDLHYSADQPLELWARRTAARLLARELPQRWAHSTGVARRAEQVARVLLPVADRPILVAAAWLHDIGYAGELVATGFHQLDGARFLARHGAPRRLCALVAYHSGAAAVADLLGLSDQLREFTDEPGQVRDALWYCDMVTDPQGRPVTHADRIAEIRARRGHHDPVVRALAVNGDDRAGAVHRTEALLRGHDAAAPPDPRSPGDPS